jgi:acyl-CoA dehydrogenase
MIDFTLSDEQKALQDLARSFTQKEIVPVALKYDKEPFTPEAILKKAHAAGLMNITTPTEYGGHGLSLLSASLIAEELCAGCAGIGGMIGINSLACGPILVGGTDEQKRRFLIPLCESGKTASFGLTEREAGSDAAGVKTKAVRKGDQYILTGQKCFITNASFATLYTIFATTDPAKGTKGITAFVVPRETPGVSIGKVEDKMGMRALNVAEVNLDEVVVSAKNVLGAEGQGFKIAMETLNEGRINIAATALRGL